MQALQDPKCDRPTGNAEFLWGALRAGSVLMWPHQEQEKDKG